MGVLRQPEYVHVLINHLPLTRLFAALLGLIVSLAVRKRLATLLSMGWISLFSLSAWPVYVYGEAGYDRVYSVADDAGDAYLLRHKTLAERWVWLFYVTSAAGALGVGAGWKWPKSLWALAGATALLTMTSLVAGAIVADAGGMVRHPEFRHGPPPAGNGQDARQTGGPGFRLKTTKPPNIACLQTAMISVPESSSRC